METNSTTDHLSFLCVIKGRGQKNINYLAGIFHGALTIQNDLKDMKIQIILEGFRNVPLTSFEYMEKTDHFQVS